MNNNNLYKRPMFRKGGSAEGGITSGLQSRPGYKVGERVTEVMDEMRTVYHKEIHLNVDLMIF